jgi:hypothetical protein
VHPNLSAFELYGIQGDSVAALKALTSDAPSSLTTDYNTAILRHVSSKSLDTRVVALRNGLLSELDGCEKKYFNSLSQEQISVRRRKRNEMIMAYNRALVLQTSGFSKECIQICREKLKDLVVKNQPPPEELYIVASRMSFLFLETTLGPSVSRSSGLVHEDLSTPSILSVMAWLNLFNLEKDPQSKFLLALCKSRLHLSESDRKGTKSESNARLARKELKAAMEILQHKLRASHGGDTESVVSSLNSEEIMSTGTHQLQESHQQLLPRSLVLQKLNQSALNLKAKLEQMKGNAKKSLLLCSEARGAAVLDSSYERINSNNLGIVYGTTGKRHLALHSLFKSLQVESEASFDVDGTSRPNQALTALYNTSLCALQAQNYICSYECMATYVSRCDVFHVGVRCWLRMAEACVGIYSSSRPSKSFKDFCAIEVNGKPKGLLFDHGLCTEQPNTTQEILVQELASGEDIQQVKRNPLLRARGCLEHLLSNQEALDNDALSTSRLMLSFVLLSFREFYRALDMARLVLDSQTLEAVEVGNDTIGVVKRRIATARMYAAEASCALGNSAEAMKYLVGDGRDDAFDRLSSDLGGVTMDMAALNGTGKRRLARAQVKVRSSASTVTAAMDNMPAAKQLAMSAQAIENAYASNRERSAARRALVYCLLRGGNHSAALTLLRSITSTLTSCQAS